MGQKVHGFKTKQGSTLVERLLAVPNSKGKTKIPGKKEGRLGRIPGKKFLVLD